MEIQYLNLVTRISFFVAVSVEPNIVEKERNLKVKTNLKVLRSYNMTPFRTIQIRFWLFIAKIFRFKTFESYLKRLLK